MTEDGYQKGMAFQQGLVKKDGRACLPHSCDDWVIGDADNVRLLIADLQAMLGEEEAA